MSASHNPEHGSGSMRPYPRSMQQGDFVAQSHTPQDCCVRFAVVVAFHAATLATGRALPLTRTGLSPDGTRQLSWRTNGWPMCSPTDASPTPSRVPTHGSGPVRIATPSPWGTFTSYSLPVFPAHRKSLISTHGQLSGGLRSFVDIHADGEVAP